MKITELFEQGTAVPPATTPAASAVTAPSAQTTSDPRFAAAQADAIRKQKQAQKMAITKQIADLQRQLADLNRTV